MQQGEYVSLEVDTDGIIKSQVFPGLWLSMSNLLAGNMQQVLAVLQLGYKFARTSNICAAIVGKGSKIL